MKILFVLPFFYPGISFGGPVTNVLELTKRLSSKGHQITVYASNAYDEKSNMQLKEKKFNENLKAYYFKNWFRILGFFITPGMITALRKNSNNFDIIHVHSTRHFQDLISYFVLSFLKKPYIMTCHGTIIPMGKAKTLKKIFDFIVGRKILQKASVIVAISPNQLHECNEMGVNNEKIKEIPFGLTVTKSDKKGVLKNRLNLENDSRIILYLGRIRFTKGIDVLIKAFRKINYPNVHLVVAGPDFGHLDYCKKMVEEFGLTSRVHFIGSVNTQERDQMFEDSELFVLPSLYEGFGTASLEAAASGLPVVLTDSCGYAKEFAKFNAGLVVKTSNIDDHANAIKQILEDPKKAKLMSENALKFVKKFDWDKVVDMHLDMYKEFSKRN